MPRNRPSYPPPPRASIFDAKRNEELLGLNGMSDFNAKLPHQEPPPGFRFPPYEAPVPPSWCSLFDSRVPTTEELKAAESMKWQKMPSVIHNEERNLEDGSDFSALATRLSRMSISNEGGDAASDEEDKSSSTANPVSRCQLNPKESLEGLKNCVEYRKYMRGKTQLAEEEDRLTCYKTLRKYEPQLFQALLRDKVINEWTQVDPPISNMLCDYIVLALGALILAHYYINHTEDRLWSPVVAWAFIQAFPWCCGTTLFCLGAGCWWVSGEHELHAGSLRVILAQCIELVFVLLTFGGGVLVSLLLKLFTQKRQSFGERLMDVHLIREVKQKVEIR